MSDLCNRSLAALGLPWRAPAGAMPRLLRGGVVAAWMGLLLGFAAHPAWAQISLVGVSTTATSSSLSTVTLNRPSGLASGDVMLAVVTTRGGGQFPATITAPAGWTSVLSRDDGSSIAMVVYRRLATGAEPASYSFALGAADRTAAAVMAFRGADGISPVNVSASQSNAASTGYAAPAVTTTTGNTLLVSVHAAVDGNGTVNTVSGMTQAFSAATGAGPNGVTVGSSYASQAAPGNTGARTSTGNASLVSLGALLALQRAAPSPLAHWRMDETLWNGTANEVTDSSGNGHHGRAMRAAGSAALPTTTATTRAYTSGAQSTCNAGQFDSATGTVRTFGYVELPTFPGMTSSFTVAAWLRSDDVANPGQRILVRDDAADGWAMSLGDGGSGQLRLFNRNISNSGAVTGNGVNPSCGVFCLDSTAVIANGNWYFVAAAVDTLARTVTLYVFSSTGAVLAVASTAYAGTWGPGSGMTAIGGETAASDEGREAAFHFKGRIDEVQVVDQALTQVQVRALLDNVRTCPVGGPDHYELSMPTSSLACLATTVTVKACSNNSSPCTSSATDLNGRTATLATTGGTLGNTTVTFDASGVATTTLSHPTAANATGVSVTLSGEEVSATNARQCCANGSSCSLANSCSTTFNTAGFIVAAAANGAAATVPAQTAGTTSAGYFLRAVQTNTTTKACEAAIQSPPAVNVSWSYQCNNPTTCSAGNLMTVTGNSAVAVAGNASGNTASSTAVPMSFDANGNAPFTFSYADVGQVTLNASRAASGTLLTALSGASNAFVVRPGGFVLSTIRQTAAPQLANPAAASGAGARFVRAGEAFSATVTATTSGGATTPNYGRETAPEGVLLTRSLVLPAGGAAGTLSNATIAGGSFSSGVATVTNLAFSEVGIITLTPSVGDGSYLGAGDTSGTTTGSIGRFFPAQFALSAGSVTHRPALSCSPASSFSYLGENFRLGLTLTAQNAAGATTTNYTGSFAKLDPASATWNLAGRDATTVFTVASTRLSLGSATGSFINGVASGITLTANAARATTPDGPFSASFGVAPVDSDGVAVAAFNMSSATGGGNDRAQVATVPLRFGRLRVNSAVGAADRALVLPVAAQHWNGTTFDTNTLDSCTAIATSALSFGNLRGTLTTADTTASGGITLAGGVGSLRLAAPGGGRSGTYDVALSLGSSATDASCLQSWTPGAGDAATAGANLAYLRGNFCASTYGNDPAARATFGRPRGLDNLVYRRENF